MLRNEILNYVETQFMGPPRGHSHQLDFIKDYMPYQHLVTGMLFPQESIIDNDYSISQDATVVDTEVDPLSLSFTYLTAVVGMSINVPTHIKKSILIALHVFMSSKKLNQTKQIIMR